ncbi:uncharacterized protein PHACADRAFT_202756 [Phanerochaete carnosa HHB-10118-sp]|uniref:Uncharacterized protein n=1 Tax=Phanerochaete carnosa (strain HHB-10118-sp) TaxID=650164 RepID=K5WE84_PHACS|nr:uncharacterized protein PHACADRAFT_202756 [Phanerochaete carnosa HHB-10118-sp]EKM48482.1 hypothetical protein PHACADRAFT_202756 [Phanerochaete carnosa HHB-10118-sp]
MSPAFCGTIITTPIPSPRDPYVWGEDSSGLSKCSTAEALQEAQVTLNYLTALHDPCSREALA